MQEKIENLLFKIIPPFWFSEGFIWSFSPGLHPRFYKRGTLLPRVECLGRFLGGWRRRGRCVNVDAKNTGEVGAGQAGVEGLTLGEAFGGPRVHDEFLVVHFS